MHECRWSMVKIIDDAREALKIISIKRKIHMRLHFHSNNVKESTRVDIEFSLLFFIEDCSRHLKFFHETLHVVDSADSLEFLHTI